MTNLEILLNRNRGVSRNGDYFSENWQQFLCFSVTFSSFNLTHRINKRNWTEEQQRNHDLIKSLHDGGMGYRKIADYLNEQGIKTARGNTWKNTQVFSVSQEISSKIRQNEECPSDSIIGIEIGTFELKWIKDSA